ncbi:FecR family protein [Hoeflea olei]|uniref:FecR family protein n=1 Tax=Hoeflea olei TaxID=1480615 RepID=UPI001FDA0CEB|nr:FecR family protein [Hoeflea olei]
MGQHNDQEQIEADAAKWVIRLGGEPLSARERAEFDRWRAQSPAHARAFAFASATWSDLAELRHDPGALARDVAPAGRWPRRAPAGGGRAWLRAGIVSLALALGLVPVAGLTAFWYGDPMVMLAADYRTGPGERRNISLPDGSTMELSSASAATLHFSASERRVELLQGAAYFTAAPLGTGETRPFVVAGADGTATALGTQFLVDRSSDAVVVTVAEHEVRVALAGTDNDARSVVLSPGQSVRYTSGAGLDAVREADVEQASAWRRGRIVFDQVPLSDVVAELNRYRRGRIVITDAALADRKVSGVFETADLDRALETIARELHARTASVPPLVTLLY